MNDILFSNKTHFCLLSNFWSTESLLLTFVDFYIAKEEQGNIESTLKLKPSCVSISP